MKKVVVFCSVFPKKETMNLVKALFMNPNTGQIANHKIIWTGWTKYNSMWKGKLNANLRLPLFPHRAEGRQTIENRNYTEFNEGLGRILGNSKADLFIFEYCPLGPTNVNRIMNILKKYSSNNAHVVTHNSKVRSNRLIPRGQIVYGGNKITNVYKLNR